MQALSSFSFFNPCSARLWKTVFKQLHTDRAQSISARVLKQMQRNTSRGPMEKGYNYLLESCNAKRCFQPVVSASADFAVTKPSPFPEIFDACLVLDLLGKKELDTDVLEACLRYISRHQGANKLFSFFEDPSLFPQDVDSSVLATNVLLDHQKVKMSDADVVADAVIANVNRNGVIQTYFPPRDGREDKIDPSVCANAIRFIHRMGRGEECKPTEDRLFAFLEKRNQDKSDLYYHTDAFFYFIWEALKTSVFLKKRFQSLLAERISARIGSSSNPIDLAARVVVSSEMGIPNHKELEKLHSLQQEDGSFPLDVAYTSSKKDLYWGSKMVTTAFALRAFHADQSRVVLPILAHGFEVASGKLKYKNSYSPLSLKFKAIAVTHTDTLASRLKRFYDADPDSPNNVLTEKGKEDAFNIARSFRDDLLKQNVVIFHGENRRTFQTASIFKMQFPNGPKLEQVSWLNEINCVDWYGNATDQILGTNATAQAMFNHSDCLAKSPNGESFLDVLNRVYEGLLNLQNRTFGQDAVVLLCTSRVNLIALKVLEKKDIELDKDGAIHWGNMSRKVGPGSQLKLRSSHA